MTETKGHGLAARSWGRDSGLLGSIAGSVTEHLGDLEHVMCLTLCLNFPLILCLESEHFGAGPVTHCVCAELAQPALILVTIHIIKDKMRARAGSARTSKANATKSSTVDSAPSLSAAPTMLGIRGSSQLRLSEQIALSAPLGLV